MHVMHVKKLLCSCQTTTSRQVMPVIQLRLTLQTDLLNKNRICAFMFGLAKVVSFLYLEWCQHLSERCDEMGGVNQDSPACSFSQWRTSLPYATIVLHLNWHMSSQPTSASHQDCTEHAPGDHPPPRDLFLRWVESTPRAKAAEEKDETRQPENEASDILATAHKNQAENIPYTRRAAIRACKYLKVLVAKPFTRYTWPPESIHNKANWQLRTDNSTNPLAAHCLKSLLNLPLPHCHTRPPLADGQNCHRYGKTAQRVTKMCRLYFADVYARKTKGCPKAYPAPKVESTIQEVQQFLPDLDAKMLGFLAEWVITLLGPAVKIVKTRALHLAFMFVKEYWFREFYLGPKARIIGGQVRCITQEHIPKRRQLIWKVEFLTIFAQAWMMPTIYPTNGTSVLLWCA